MNLLIPYAIIPNLNTPIDQLSECEADFTATAYTVPPKPKALLATLEIWHKAAEIMGNTDSTAVIKILKDAANQDQHLYYATEKMPRKGTFKFVAVAGGATKEIQAIAYIRETSDDTEIIRLATAPWNMQSDNARAYGKAYGKEPVRGAGTACVAACLLAGNFPNDRSLTLSAIDSAVNFYKRIGFEPLQYKDFKPTDDLYLHYKKNLMRLNLKKTSDLFKKMLEQLPLTKAQ